MRHGTEQVSQVAVLLLTVETQVPNGSTLMMWVIRNMNVFVLNVQILVSCAQTLPASWCRSQNINVSGLVQNLFSGTTVSGEQVTLTNTDPDGSSGAQVLTLSKCFIAAPNWQSISCTVFGLWLNNTTVRSKRFWMIWSWTLCLLPWFKCWLSRKEIIPGLSWLLLMEPGRKGNGLTGFYERCSDWLTMPELCDWLCSQGALWLDCRAFSAASNN